MSLKLSGQEADMTCDSMRKGQGRTTEKNLSRRMAVTKEVECGSSEKGPSANVEYEEWTNASEKFSLVKDVV